VLDSGIMTIHLVMDFMILRDEIMDLHQEIMVSFATFLCCASTFCAVHFISAVQRSFMQCLEFVCISLLLLLGWQAVSKYVDAFFCKILEVVCLGRGNKANHF